MSSAFAIRKLKRQLSASDAATIWRKKPHKTLNYSLSCVGLCSDQCKAVVTASLGSLQCVYLEQLMP